MEVMHLIKTIYFTTHTAEYRYTSLAQRGAIQSIDVSVGFENPQDGTIYPLFMGVNTDMYIKLLFRKKKKYRNTE